MSRPIDFSKCKDAFINSIQVGEMWFQGIMLYVKKRRPTVELELKAVGKSGNYGIVKMTAQFVDYEHRYRYADETNYSTSLNYTHGILFLGGSATTTLTPTTSGVNKVKFTKYNDDGTFSYTYNRASVNSRIRFRAWVTIIDPDTGETVTIYSRQIRKSYNDLVNTA